MVTRAEPAGQATYPDFGIFDFDGYDRTLLQRQVTSGAQLTTQHVTTNNVIRRNRGFSPILPLPLEPYKVPKHTAFLQKSLPKCGNQENVLWFGIFSSPLLLQMKLQNELENII